MYKIAVFGSAMSSDKEIRDKALMVGEEIARNVCTLITGGCNGLPYEAVKGATNRGHTVAFSPAINREEYIRFGLPVKGNREFVYILRGFFPFTGDKLITSKYRNVISCASCDAGVIISRRMGIMNEFTNLYSLTYTM